MPMPTIPKIGQSERYVLCAAEVAHPEYEVTGLHITPAEAKGWAYALKRSSIVRAPDLH
jgi:hypothetical protein